MEDQQAPYSELPTTSGNATFPVCPAVPSSMPPESSTTVSYAEGGLPPCAGARDFVPSGLRCPAPAAGPRAVGGNQEQIEVIGAVPHYKTSGRSGVQMGRWNRWSNKSRMSRW